MFIKETDYILYQKLVGVLVPDVLRAVPSSLTQLVRNFAKSLENWLIGSMSEMPKEIVNVKVRVIPYNIKLFSLFSLLISNVCFLPSFSLHYNSEVGLVVLA